MKVNRCGGMLDIVSEQTLHTVRDFVHPLPLGASERTAAWHNILIDELNFTIVNKEHT